jgi:hypothetical protein
LLRPWISNGYKNEGKMSDRICPIPKYVTSGRRRHRIFK